MVFKSTESCLVSFEWSCALIRTAHTFSMTYTDRKQNSYLFEVTHVFGKPLDTFDFENIKTMRSQLVRY